MRWKSEISDTAGLVLTVVTAPIWVPVAASIAALAGVAWAKRWVAGPRAEWRPWLAWFPVEVIDDNGAPAWVWLEWVDRRSYHVFGEIQHRLLAQKEGGK